ncbi:DUF167 domain-containing protein [Patescibacteria group bacterium]|nr:DUF167 domain-containing protein [Patescibacteria group bacterium]
MRIFIKAKPNSKKESIEKLDETHFTVSVKEPPVKGLANRAIAKALVKYFNLSSSQVYLVSGFISKQKVFEIKID